MEPSIDQHSDNQIYEQCFYCKLFPADAQYYNVSLDVNRCSDVINSVVTCKANVMAHYRVQHPPLCYCVCHGSVEANGSGVNDGKVPQLCPDHGSCCSHIRLTWRDLFVLVLYPFKLKASSQASYQAFLCYFYLV